MTGELIHVVRAFISFSKTSLEKKGALVLI